MIEQPENGKFLQRKIESLESEALCVTIDKQGEI
jgi:hypothetical protein